MPNLLINVKTKGVHKANNQVSKLNGGLKMLSGSALAAVGGTAALGLAMKKSIQLAAEQEKQERMLAKALGTNTDALLAQAGALQQSSVFGDEAIIQQQAYMASIGMSEKQIKDYMPVILDLASATGMSLESAVKNASKTLSGMTGELGESVPALRELTAEELKAGKGMDVMRDMFKGMAETESKTLQGSLTQTSNAIGDMGEAFGDLIAPIVSAGASMVKDFAEKTEKAFDFLGTIDFTATAQNMIGNLGALQTLIVDSFKLTFKMIPDFFRFFMSDIVPAGIKIFTKLLNRFIENINGFIKRLQAIGKFIFEPLWIGLQIVIGKVRNGFITMTNFIKEQLNDIIGIANTLGANIKPFEMSKLIDLEGLSIANTQMAQLLKEGGEDNLNTFEDFQNAQAEIYQKYADKVIQINQETNEKKKEDGNENPAAISSNLTDKNNEELQKMTDGWAKGLNDVGTKVSTWSDAVGGLYNSLYENKKMWRDKDMNNEIKMVQKSKLSEEEKNAKIQNIREKYNQKDLDAKKAMKPVKYAEAISNIALGVSNALSAAPPPLNIALAAITAAAGAVQLSTIASSEYAQGGLVGGKRHSQGGTLIEAEQGEFVMRRSAVNRLGVSAMNAINQGMYENGGLVSNRIANITNINAPNQEPQQEVANVTVNVSGNVMSQDYVEGELAEQIKDAVRRGADFGVI